MELFNITILTEGELIDTYGGDLTYRDTGYTKNSDGTFSFYFRDHGAKPTDGWELNDDPDEIEELTEFVRNEGMRQALIKAVENNEFIHGAAVLRNDLVNKEGEVIISKGEDGLITAYLPEDKTFAVMFKDNNGWHTFHESEKEFKERFFTMLKENLN